MSNRVISKRKGNNPETPILKGSWPSGGGPYLGSGIQILGSPFICCHAPNRFEIQGIIAIYMSYLWKQLSLLPN